MNTTTCTILSTFVLATAFGALPLAADPPVALDPADEVSQIPPIPPTPAGAIGLLHAQPFTLEAGYEFEWRAEKPTVAAGWLLVLEVDGDMVFPRQLAQPILYVGQTTAERINEGHESGRVIAIVPSDLNEKGEVSLDLSGAIMWFGTPGLPEQVDAAKVEAERQSALAAKIAPFSQEIIDAARAKAQATLKVADRTALRQAAAQLVKVHSPQEVELIDSILAESAAQAGAPKSK